MENTQMKPAELLEQVNKAIAAVLVGGQSYKIGSRSLTRADLATGGRHGGKPWRSCGDMTRPAMGA